MLQTTPANLQPFLDRLISRSVLTEAEQQAVVELPSRAFQAARNQDFVKLGERVDHSCFVVDGLVGRFDQNSNGDRQITALHLPGSVADLLSVVQPVPTSALQALCTTTILQIPHQALRGLTSEYPAVAEAFWRDCAVDAMVMAQWLVNLGRRQAKDRIAHLLCELAVRSDVDLSAGEVRFVLSMTQDQLADATGLTSVHVNRSLMALRDIGTTFRGFVVRIDDWQRLRDIGDFDPSYLQANIAPAERLRIMQVAA